ncbi:hypothetical protein B0T20DRAFT_184736 [Sordaria brevicollis]|uniref:Uncharacterized protein n=1 Tax=Sordaria brevicollis TaxID=83679 RepID=A0AAE0UCC6_SORBR|nr:hypothetical protein B0T20DRAFT_184736 [Sordaria brevicollis]
MTPRPYRLSEGRIGPQATVISYGVIPSFDRAQPGHAYNVIAHRTNFPQRFPQTVQRCPFQCWEKAKKPMSSSEFHLEKKSHSRSGTGKDRGGSFNVATFPPDHVKQSQDRLSASLTRPDRARPGSNQLPRKLPRAPATPYSSFSADAHVPFLARENASFSVLLSVILMTSCGASWAIVRERKPSTNRTIKQVWGGRSPQGIRGIPHSLGSRPQTHMQSSC